MKKTVVLIAGPTAVGKTALAIRLAQYFHTEIISADSRQCYQEISIGVAKPSPAELQLVKHHFIHSYSIYEKINAAFFEAFALNAVEKIFQQQDIAVMVGGTGLYIHAFCEGMDEIPAVDEAVRQQLKHHYQQSGIVWLQQQIQLHDPLFAKEGETQNPQRMLRALEVILSTGKSILQFRKGERKKKEFNCIKIGLNLEREELYQRINHRVDVMMQEGLEAEARSVYSLRHLNALQTVGYRELFDYFDGKTTLVKAVELIKQHSRHYAKRQLTWFKRDEEVHWFHPLQWQEILQYITDQIKKPEV